MLNKTVPQFGRVGARRLAVRHLVLVLFGLAFAVEIFVPHEARANQVSSRSDTLTNSVISVTSNHTIIFTAQNNITSAGGASASSNVSVTFPSDFNLSTFTCNDVDLSVAGTATSLNVSNGDGHTNCPNTATSWGVNIDSANRVILFTSPTSAAQWTWVATGTALTVNIGSNAQFQGSGTHWITNVSNAGTKTITIGSTTNGFGGSGNILVAILSPVTVQATVAESLALTVTGVMGDSPVNGNTYPHIYSNGSTAGWETANVSFTDRSTVVDPRLAGVNQHPNDGTQMIFRVDLPVVGNYSVRLALGDAGIDQQCYQYLQIEDNGTVLLTIDKSSGTTVNHYYDATGILRTSDTDWATNNTATTLSFSTTIFRMIIGTPSANPDCGNGNSSTIAHLLIQQANGSNPTGFDFRGTANYVSDPSNCTADDGATVNGIKTGATSVAFGTVSPNTFYFGCQDLVVSTNAGNGYSLTTQESSAMKTVNGMFTIPDTTCDAGTCSESAAAAWTNATKSGLGHTCFNQNNHDCDASYSSGTKFRQFANIAAGEPAQAIMSSTTPATVTGRIKIRLSAGTAQAPGTYTTLITYTILGTF